MRPFFTAVTLLPIIAFFAIAPLRFAVAAGEGINPSSESLSNGILPDCEAYDSNVGENGNGCGISDAIQLVYNIIKYITYIVIPIATLLLGYAGFTIMTSAGNSEKMTQAKGMITKVVIGLAIIFTSTLIVRYIFIALQVEDQYLPG